MGGEGMRAALRVSLTYILLAGLWIFLSDRLVPWLTLDPTLMTQIHSYKGWAFVLFTGAMLFYVLHREFGRRETVEAAQRESEERYRTLFENSLDAMLLSAPDGRILAANPAASRMFGRTAEEICAGGWGELVDAADPRLAAAMQAQARSGRFQGELSLRRANGSILVGEISTALFQTDRGEARTSLIIRDVTERNRTEDALRRHAERLGLLREVDTAILAAEAPTASAMRC